MTTINILESDTDIQRMITASMAPLVNKHFNSKIPQIVKESRELAQSWISSQKEITSLLSASPDSLAGAFGVSPARVGSIVGSIVGAVSNSVSVDIKKFDRNLRGSLSINFQPADFSNLISLREGHTVYDGGDLHWLKWLLTLGSAPIISNYEYVASPGQGRSGLGIMKIGGSFRVPPKFAGNPNNNFVTRAFDGKGDQIVSMLERILR